MFVIGCCAPVLDGYISTNVLTGGHLTSYCPRTASKLLGSIYAERGVWHTMAGDFLPEKQVSDGSVDLVAEFGESPTQDVEGRKYTST